MPPDHGFPPTWLETLDDEQRATVREETIALSWLVDLDDTFMRSHLREEAVADYAEVLDELPPVLAVRSAEGQVYWLADGRHRVAAARKAGHGIIRAITIVGTKTDALRAGAHANRKNGVRFTTKDKNAVVRRLLADPEIAKLSNAKIAALALVSRGIVNKHRGPMVDTDAQRKRREHLNRVVRDPAHDHLSYKALARLVGVSDGTAKTARLEVAAERAAKQGGGDQNAENRPPASIPPEKTSAKPAGIKKAATAPPADPPSCAEERHMRDCFGQPYGLKLIRSRDYKRRLRLTAGRGEVVLDAARIDQLERLLKRMRAVVEHDEQKGAA